MAVFLIHYPRPMEDAREATTDHLWLASIDRTDLVEFTQRQPLKETYLTLKGIFISQNEE